MAFIQIPDHLFGTPIDLAKCSRDALANCDAADYDMVKEACKRARELSSMHPNKVEFQMRMFNNGD